MGHERVERRVELRALGLARRGDRASGGESLLRRARRRLFRAPRRNADPAARPGIFDLFDRGGHAAARRQAAGDRSQRLDDQRQRSGLPGSELSEPPAHQAHEAEKLPSQRNDCNPGAPGRRMSGVATFELAPGYPISRVIRGGWQLAGGHGPIDRAAALDDLVAAFDAGIFTFDCADIYTGVEELYGEMRARLVATRGIET